MAVWLSGGNALVSINETALRTPSPVSIGMSNSLIGRVLSPRRKAKGLRDGVVLPYAN